MNPALLFLICALIGSQMVINFFLGQLLITLITYFSEKRRQLRRSSEDK